MGYYENINTGHVIEWNGFRQLSKNWKKIEASLTIEDIEKAREEAEEKMKVEAEKVVEPEQGDVVKEIEKTNTGKRKSSYLDAIENGAEVENKVEIKEYDNFNDIQKNEKNAASGTEAKAAGQSYVKNDNIWRKK